MSNVWEERLRERLASEEYRVESTLRELLALANVYVDQGVLYYVNRGYELVAWQPATNVAQALDLLITYAPLVRLVVVLPAIAGTGWHVVFVDALQAVELAVGQGRTFALALCEALIAFLRPTEVE